MASARPVSSTFRAGSCWAFAAVAELESRRLMNNYGTSDLSEQQVLNCNPYAYGAIIDVRRGRYCMGLIVLSDSSVFEDLAELYELHFSSKGLACSWTKPFHSL